MFKAQVDNCLFVFYYVLSQEKSAVYSAVKKSWVPRRLSTISFNDTPSYNDILCIKNYFIYLFIS